MTNIEEILSQAVERLRDAVPELAFVGRRAAGASDMPVPHALLDVGNVDYTQQGRGAQLAEAQLTVEVAGAPADTSCAVFGLLDRVHAALHGFTAGDHAPLCRTNLKRTSDAAGDSYTATYLTAFDVGGCPDAAAAPLRSVALHVE